MLFYVPDIVCCPFNIGTMYVILCSWCSILHLWPRYNVCYSAFLILFPAPSTLAQCMLLYVPALVSPTVNAGTMYVFYVPDIVSRPSDVGSMYVILCSWNRSFDPNQVYVIACVSDSIPPLQLRPSVCYSMFLIKYPAPSTPAQCMLFYVPDIVSRPFDPGTMCVILCSWFSILSLQPWHYVCCSIFLKKYPAPLAPTKCMLLHVSPIVSRPFNPGPMYVILCFW
jgi:hypothetical protein